MTDENNNNIPPVPNAGSNQPPAPYGQNPQAPQYSAPQAPQYGAPQYGNAPQGQYGAPQGQYGAQPAKWNVLSIITLVSGVLGFSVISIVLGIISLNQIKKTGEQGKVLAIIGIILGALYTLGYILLAIGFVALLNSPDLYDTTY
ncbi:DUF4190 domain-containing protein [Mycetocola zhadangensis]|uniref:DUF4190 domain-containing protein n=1 Tax=Mycetocola zhadangensis TaxID=1164595 RepID=A0A3L7J606_9MICO|nr:DUF4190 domain-containing protein [Mycetocola zhadangensis]RLQ83962.1 DUF4190 domain-containing protein [Mycetocola zhadangensis]GGE97345.1 hypothetical protein GCM10011313_20470 [Mycetocola zhadangensis]